MRPIIDGIESFTLVNAGGGILKCSRSENEDWFRLAQTLHEEKGRAGTLRAIFHQWPTDNPAGKAAFSTRHGILPGN